MTTLVGFVTVLLGFVIAPLLVVAAALLVLAMMRPRPDRTERSGSTTSTTPGRVAYGFGAGTQ